MDDFTSDDFISMDNGVSLDEQLTMLPTKPKRKKQKKHVDTNKYATRYNDVTSSYYVAMRRAKVDPITSDLFEQDDPKAFKFKYMWDPYTGDRLGIDPYGPLYFNPSTLIKHFHTKRLFNLWSQATDSGDGYFQGYYGCAVGAGDEGFVPGRGHHPEWHLFRLPIPNCYLTPDHNHQIITMGPKLTEEELLEIESIANSYWVNQYKRDYKAHLPSLCDMYKHYSQATSEYPLDDSDYDELSSSDRTNAINKANREAVDFLVNMKG